MSGKKLAIIGLAFVLILGGAAFGLYTWKMSSPAFQGISLPTQDVEDEVRERWVESLKKIAEEEAVIKAIAVESGYQSLMGLDSEEAAHADLAERILVKYRKRRKTIEVGLTGIRKEDDKLKTVAPFIYKVCASILAKNDQSFAAFSSQKRQ